MKNFINFTKEIFAGLLLISLLAIASCSKDSDPAPTNTSNGTGSVASTCINALGGTGSFKVNGTSNATTYIVVGVCSGNDSYTATISGSNTNGNAGAIAINFKGMPNAGTFGIVDPIGFSSTTAKNMVYIAAADGNSSTAADFVSSNVSQLVTVERTGNTIRIKLPSVQLKRAGTNTTATFEADFSVTF